MMLMLSEMSRVFQKNSCIKKSVEQSKNKECKKRYPKKRLLRKFCNYV